MLPNPLFERRPALIDGDLVIRNLHVSVEGKRILQGIDLTVRKGEVHALTGPNARARAPSPSS